MIDENIISEDWSSDTTHGADQDINSSSEAAGDSTGDETKSSSEPMTCEERYELVCELTEHGFSVIPLATKSDPMIKWGKYQLEIADSVTLATWFKSWKAPGIAIICGPASQNLIIIDIEKWEIYCHYRQRIVDAGRSDLVERLTIVKTGKGGCHIYCRLASKPPGGRHLAERPVIGQKELELLIETRGTGNYVMAPGSEPKCHERNVSYEEIQGRIKDTPVISNEDWEFLVKIAESFDEKPQPIPNQGSDQHKQSFSDAEELSPAVLDYNEAGDIPDVLARNGFKLVKQAGPESYWCREDSTTGDHNFTFNFGNDGKLRNFSENNSPFKVRTYTAFEAYALLEHDGDHAAAEVALKAEGYGLDYWDEPAEIRPIFLTAPTMTPDLLPEPIRDWVTDTSSRMETPPEGVAISYIVTLSSLVGAGCAIRPKAKDDWTVIPNLWGMLIGRPGVILKTPTLLAGTFPLKPLQERAKKAYLDARAAYDTALDSYQFELQRLKKKYGNNTKSIADYSAEKLLLSKPVEPLEKRYLTNEASMQKLTDLHKGNPRGIIKFHDELFGLISRLNQETNREERAFYLTAWNGTGSYEDDKIGRGNTYAANLCISLLGGIQPDLLQSLLQSDRKTKSSISDGFIARFQLAVWPEEQIRGYVDRDPDEEANRRIGLIFDRLDSMDFTNHGAKQDSKSPIPYYRFSAAAQFRFEEWMLKLEMQIREETSALMQEHLSKYRSLCPSLALLFHLTEIADGKNFGDTGVSETALKLAIAWCQFLELHARKIYALLDSAPERAVNALIAKIKAGELKDGFSVRDIHRKKWQDLTDVEIVKQAVQELVRVSWLWEVVKAGRFRHKGTTTYWINPKISLAN